MATDHHAEQNRLETIAAQSTYGAGANEQSIRYGFQVFKRFIGKGAILEMGPAEGIMTDLLATLSQPLTIVEGSKLFCDEIQARHPTVTVVNSLFEAFEPGAKFGTIILGHVLEHVDDPVGLVRRAAKWLEPNGKIIAAVPNSRSVHRQAAVLMGMLGFEEEMNEADRRHGHRRVYNPETFRREFIVAGMRIQFFGGFWLKPLANSQIETHWNKQMLTAFMALGERYPDIAAQIYVVAENPPS